LIELSRAILELAEAEILDARIIAEANARLPAGAKPIPYPGEVLAPPLKITLENGQQRTLARIADRLILPGIDSIYPTFSHRTGSGLADVKAALARLDALERGAKRAA